MNLLVTGGAGFIGSNAVRFLAKQSSIKKLVNLDCLTYAGHLENLRGIEPISEYVFEQADLRDLASLRRVFAKHAITYVIHLAAESHVDRSIAAPADFVTTNVIGTFNLLEVARERGNEFRRFLHVSTDEVFGSLGREGYFDERSSYAPNSPYSASKAASDMLVRSYHHTYGIETIITNCSNNYGPHQYPEKLIPVVIQNVVHRRVIPVYGDGTNVRDWLHVADHVEALWQLLQRGRAGESYGIGARNELSNIRLVEMICDIIDELRPELGGNSRRLISFVQDRPGHDWRYAIDPTKIESEIGWRPKANFKEVLRETVRWYLENQDWVRAVIKA